MSFPKPDPSCKAFLESILPPDPQVQMRAMFGNHAGFANGHMFAGTFGSDIVVRLPEAERAHLLQETGTSIFSPTEGRVMKEYVVLPRAWRAAPDQARHWIACAMAWVSQMPPKAARKPAQKQIQKQTRKPAAKKTAAKKKTVKKAPPAG